MNEDLAKQIGIAYGVYKIICAKRNQDAVTPAEFKKICCNSIEEIRSVSGLVDEDSITG